MSKTAPRLMDMYNQDLAVRHAKKSSVEECVERKERNEPQERAAAALGKLMKKSSFESDGVSFTTKDGNRLKVDGTSAGNGYAGYSAVVGEREAATKKAKGKQQSLNTLRVEKEHHQVILKKHAQLEQDGLSIDDVNDTLVETRPGAAFVIAVVFLIGRDCVDYHLVNSANGEVAFAWHVDNHAEHDRGKKIYIDRSVAWQLSPGETSMFIAGLDCDAFPRGEVRYQGVGSAIDFPAYMFHRTGRVEVADGEPMWKLVGFYPHTQARTDSQKLTLDKESGPTLELAHSAVASPTVAESASPMDVEAPRESGVEAPCESGVEAPRESGEIGRAHV